MSALLMLASRRDACAQLSGPLYGETEMLKITYYMRHGTNYIESGMSERTENNKSCSIFLDQLEQRGRIRSTRACYCQSGRDGA